MQPQKFIIPTITLSFSCNPPEPIQEGLCTSFQTIDPMNNLHMAEDWREEYCAAGFLGYWEAKSFGYWYSLPVSQSYSSPYNYGSFSYSISGEMYITAEQAYLDFRVYISFYGSEYNNYYSYEGSWEKQDNQYIISMPGNQSSVEMECNQENTYLN